MTRKSDYPKVDLSPFDVSDEARVSHWRGFTKYAQPNGTVIGCYKSGDGKGIVLGPAKTGAGIDRLISDFYSEATT